MLFPGYLLSDRYQLAERVAAGGMGEVWRGTDVLLRREVAVKVLLPSLMSDAEFIARFRTEARMMAALRHPGIVQVYDYGEDVEVDGSRLDFLVMEYIEGAPLSKWIRAAGKLGITETMSVVTQAAEALHVAHSAGIVHRDVKPSNLLVRPDGVVVLVDFGVARSTATTGITATNMVLGTADYMAPEQAVGQPVSAATDIYALGAVAYCCLAGRPPFTGDNPLQVVSQHLQVEPPTLPAGEIPASVAALVSRALAKDPADRYPSAAAFAEAARAAQAGPPIAANVLRGGPPAPANGPAQGPPAAGAPSWHSGAGARTGEPVADPPLYFPPKAPRSNRRRNATLAGVAAAVLLIGLAAVMIAFRPEAAQSQTRPTHQVGDAGRSPGAGLGPGQGQGPGVVPAPNGDPLPPAASSKPGKQTARPARPAASATTPQSTETTTGSATQPTTATTTTAAAVKNPYTPGQVCGSGFSVIDSATLTASGSTVAKVYLLYNSSTGSNCATTLKTTAVGSKTTVAAYLEVQGGSRSTDSGSFSYYAGPVRAKAAGVCVKWGGSAAGASYNSPFEHCD